MEPEAERNMDEHNDAFAVLVSGYDETGRFRPTLVLRDATGRYHLRDVTEVRDRAAGPAGRPPEERRTVSR